MAPIQQAMVQTPIVSPLHRNTGFVQVASPSMPTQPPTDSGMRYEYRHNCHDALCVAAGKYIQLYGSLHIPERLTDESACRMQSAIHKSSSRIADYALCCFVCCFSLSISGRYEIFHSSDRLMLAGCRTEERKTKKILYYFKGRYQT